MSSTYAGADTFGATITIPDDGDPANASTFNVPYEGLADRTRYLLNRIQRDGELIPLGSRPFVGFTTTYTLTGLGMYLLTSGTAGGEVLVPIDLVHGRTVSLIEVFFVPVGGHGGLPTLPYISFFEFAIGASDTPAWGAADAQNYYVTADLTDYNNGEMKVMSLAPNWVVDAENNIYIISVGDETGGNKLPGNAYYAYRITYA